MRLTDSGKNIYNLPSPPPNQIPNYATDAKMPTDQWRNKQFAAYKQYI